MVFNQSSNNYIKKSVLASNKGFTLVEMIVTLVVMSIALTLAGLGILAWQDWSDFNRQNEYAQTLFVAAQNQLSEYSANGRLLELQEAFAIENNGKDDATTKIGMVTPISSLTKPDGNAYNLNAIWPESLTEADGDKYRYRDTIVSVMASVNDYNAYLDNPENFKASNPQAYWVYELISPYVYDVSVLKNGAVCIEFTPEDGQVFAVFYSDKNTSFSYAGDALGGTVNVSDRQTSYREPRMIGYYGVDSLSKATDAAMEELEVRLTNAMLYNENTCHLSFEVDKDSVNDNVNAVNELTYTIDVKDAISDEKKFSIILEGDSLTGNVTEKPVKCDIIKYDGDTANVVGSYPILCTVTDVWNIDVILDAADIQAATTMYESEIDTLCSNAANAATGSLFAKTLSYFRFGVDTNNIYCEITASGDRYKDSDSVDSNVENPVFQTAQNNSGNYEYTIDNGRHLYNVRYIEDISYANEAKPAGQTVNSAEFIVHSNIDWAAFQANTPEGKGLYDSYDTTSFVDLSLKGLDRFTCDFPSFRNVRTQDTIRGWNSANPETISGLNMSLGCNSFYGFYTNFATRGANNGSGDEASRPTGFVNYNQGTIKDLKLTNESVEGKQVVGGFAGINAGQLVNIYNDTTCNVTGDSDVGGIIGFQMPSGDEIKIENLTNRATVNGNKAVGGIVGMLRNDFTGYDFSKLGSDVSGFGDITGNIVVNNCKNYGQVAAAEGATSEQMFIGGIAGYVYNKVENDTSKIVINNCTSSPWYNKEDLITQLANKDVIEAKLNGVYVGGIVGYNYFGSINACSTKAEGASGGYVLGSKYVGGIVGFNLGPTSGLVGGTGVQGTNENNVIGKMYVGGITGCNAYVADEFEDGTAVTSKDPEKMGDHILKPAEARQLAATVKSWANRGIVVATDSYAGGITGYNTGWIYGCTSVVDAAKADATFSGVTYGKYVGGVSGYNNGIIGNTNRTNVNNVSTADGTGTRIVITSYIKGQDYLGGVVGYNDVDSIVENYEVAGGYVIGTPSSCYVGGYAGLNSSVNLLMDESTGTGVPRAIRCNPTKVEGGYFVGGVIGGNIINTNGRATKGGVTNAADGANHVDVTGKIYAIFENPPTETWGGSGVYHIVNGLKIYNNSPNDITCWTIHLGDANVNIERISGGTYDASKNDITWNNAALTGITANGGTLSLYDLEVTGSLDELNKLYQKPLSVSFYGNNTNNYGEYAGAYEGQQVSTVECVERETGNPDYTVNKYEVTVWNKSDTILPNYRLELEVPEGSSIDNCSGMGYELVGNKLIFKTASVGTFTNYIIQPGGNINFTFQLRFKDEATWKAYATPNVKVFFNNVYYTSVIDTQNGTNSGGGIDLGPTGPTDIPGKGDITADITTNSFLGTLNGNAFVGGFMGYTMLIDSTDNTYVDKLQQQIVTTFDSNTSIGPDSLASKINYLDSLKSGSGYNASKSTLYLIGDNTSGSRSNLGAISADVYVGGVVGYNNSESLLYIKNVVNASPVTARLAITNPQEQLLAITDENGTVTRDENGVVKVGTEPRTTDYKGDPFTYTYSYAGGMIGKCTTSTVIDNCKNDSFGTVTSSGTYTGGVCELNDGHIINCVVPSFGNGYTDYLGSICGLNEYNGVVKDCSINGSTITGRSVVGGIAAENFGNISGIELENAQMMATGKAVPTPGDGENPGGQGANGSGAGNNIDGVTGLYAGYNGNTGIIEITKNVSGTVTSSGNYVGIITGYNSGVLDNSKAESIITGGVGGNVIISGTVTGNRLVGALAGCNDSVDKTYAIQYFTSTAIVKATHGDAGGIIGKNDSQNTIQYCANKGEVTAVDDGNAGGITSINNSNIFNCINYKEVSSPNGYSGGITALNGEKGHIEKCTVQPLDGATNIIFISKLVAGGIAAENAGLIKDNTMRGVTVTNYSTDQKSIIGIIAGKNLPTGIIDLKTDLNISDSRAVANTNGCLLGGIAGKNEGLIEGVDNNGSLPTSVVNSELVLNASYASIGGVAGQNTGTIKNIAVISKVEGVDGYDGYAYGGIAGFNGYNKSYEASGKETAVISNCTFDGIVSSRSSNVVNMVRVGGIAGVNGYGGKIENSYIGVRDTDVNGRADTTTTISYGDISKDYTSPDTNAAGYAGGITAENYGTIAPCDNHTHSTDNVNIIGFKGFVGGIAGITHQGSSISGTDSAHKMTTGSNWVVDLRYAANDQGSGGIVGYYDSGEDLQWIENYALVKCLYESNNKAGGITAYIDQTFVPELKVNNVINYGNVECYNAAGGFFGALKAAGATFTDCKNYGNIKGGRRYISGFVAYVQKSPLNANFYNCQNHGNLHAVMTYYSDDFGAGAFIGRTQATAKGYMYNCVNTGCILREDPVDSKYDIGYGVFVGHNDNKMVIDYCRNYGTNILSNGYPCVTNGFGAYASFSFDLSNLRHVRGTTVRGTTTNPYYPFYAKLINVGKDNESVDEDKNVANKMDLYLDEDSKIDDPTNPSVDLSVYGDNNAKVERLAYAIGYNGHPVWVYRINSIDTGFEMKDNTNPFSDSYFNDHSDFDISWLSTAGNGANSRWNVYREIDPKICEFITTTNSLNGGYFQAPSNLKLAKYEAGIANFTWSAVTTYFKNDGTKVTNATPAGYLVHYTVTKNGQELYTADNVVGAGQTQYSVPIDQSWVNPDTKLTISVTTLSFDYYGPNHIVEERSRSKDLEVSLQMKTLPIPQMHLELTGDNKFVAVLDNYEDYFDSEGNPLDVCVCLNINGHKDSLESVNHAPRGVDLEGTAGTSGNKFIIEWNIKEFGAICPEEINIYNNNANQDYKYYAYPNPDENPNTCDDNYCKSNTSWNITQFVGAVNLPSKVDYAYDAKNTGGTYFYGFHGDTPESMSYEIAYQMNNVNTSFGFMYMTADLCAYDENIGATVSYCNKTTYIAASQQSAATSFNVTLDNIPSTWFSSTGEGNNMPDKILVRNYLYRSQNNFAHYGHEVVGDNGMPIEISLNGDKVANQDTLRNIVDNNYIAVDGDGNRVRTSMPIYNGKDLNDGYVLYLQDNGTYTVYYSATLENAINAARNLGDRTYSKYYVTYAEYVKFTDSKPMSNGFDLKGSYLVRGLETNSSYIYRFNEGNTAKTWTDNAWYSDISKTNIYAFYKEVSVAPNVDPTTGGTSGADAFGHTTYTFVWDEFDPAIALDKMLYENATYKIQLIGTTSGGKEVVLEEFNADNNDSLYDNGAGKKYYAHTFTDTNNKWGNYVSITGRIIALGSTSTYNGKPAKYSETMRLPIYVDVKIDNAKPALGPMLMPEVAQVMDASKQDYKVTFQTITDTFPAIQEAEKPQKNDVGGYLVTVKQVPEEGKTIAEEDLVVRYYYIKTATIPEMDLASLALPADKLIEIAAENYETITSGDVVLGVMTIDMTPFSGLQVDVSVKAVAIEQAPNYRHSADSPAKRIIIADRMPVPDVAKVNILGNEKDGFDKLVIDKGMADYDNAVIVSETETEPGTDDPLKLENTTDSDRFTAGFYLNYFTDEAESPYYTITDLKINASVAIYPADTDITASVATITNVGDMPIDPLDPSAQTDGYWNTGALETLHTKADPLVMTGTVTPDVSVDINGILKDIPVEYADCYLKIALQATSDNHIHSAWTDEDAASLNTVNYLWIRIPKLQTKDVDIAYKDESGKLITEASYGDGVLVWDVSKAIKLGLETLTIDLDPLVNEGTDATDPSYELILKTVAVDDSNNISSDTVCIVVNKIANDPANPGDPEYYWQIGLEDSDGSYHSFNIAPAGIGSPNKAPGEKFTISDIITGYDNLTKTFNIDGTDLELECTFSIDEDKLTIILPNIVKYDNGAGWTYTVNTTTLEYITNNAVYAVGIYENLDKDKYSVFYDFDEWYNLAEDSSILDDILSASGISLFMAPYMPAGLDIEDVWDRDDSVSDNSASSNSASSNSASSNSASSNSASGNSASGNSASGSQTGPSGGEGTPSDNEAGNPVDDADTPSGTPTGTPEGETPTPTPGEDDQGTSAGDSGQETPPGDGGSVSGNAGE